MCKLTIFFPSFFLYFDSEFCLCLYLWMFMLFKKIVTSEKGAICVWKCVVFCGWVMDWSVIYYVPILCVILCFTFSNMRAAYCTKSANYSCLKENIEIWFVVLLVRTLIQLGLRYLPTIRVFLKLPVIFNDCGVVWRGTWVQSLNYMLLFCSCIKNDIGRFFMQVEHLAYFRFRDMQLMIVQIFEEGKPIMFCINFSPY